MMGEAAAAAALRLAVNRQQRPTISVQGRSMRPLLHEKMTLELAPFDPSRAVGDMVVLDLGGDIVVRRIVRRVKGGWITSPDADPLAAAKVNERKLIGRVSVVYAHHSAGRSIPRRLVEAYGVILARAHPLRAFWARMWVQTLAGLQIVGWRSGERPFWVLLDVMEAAVTRDCSLLKGRLNSCRASSLISVALRHACTAILLDALEGCDEGTTEEFAPLIRGLQTSANAIEREIAAARAQIGDLVRILNKADVSYALLKGAARIYAEEADAVLHPITDIDILVRRDHLERSAEALLKHGYQYALEANKDRYLLYHHHAAPLRQKGKGLNVELHFALAAPSLLSEQLDWQALKPYLVTINGRCGTAKRLDAVRTALHLCIHSVGITKLRDIVLLGSMLHAEPSLFDALLAFIETERWDTVRLAAALALAARIARLGTPEDHQVTEYIQWVIGREDLPDAIRLRTANVEARYRTRLGQRRASECDTIYANHSLHPKRPSLKHVVAYAAIGWLAPIAAARLVRAKGLVHRGIGRAHHLRTQYYNNEDGSLTTTTSRS